MALLILTGTKKAGVYPTLIDLCFSRTQIVEVLKSPNSTHLLRVALKVVVLGATGEVLEPSIVAFGLRRAPVVGVASKTTYNASPR